MDDFLGSDGVTIIEWSERLSAKMDSAIEIEIEDAGDDLRVLHIRIPATSRKKQSQSVKAVHGSRIHDRRRLN
jgi:tRNA A37 threonylcarbamoyladenosine biosynthesis protein TsaE